MCGIIDANAVGDALSGDPEEAAPRFLAWASSGGEKLVISSALLAEITNQKAKLWFQQGLTARRVKRVTDDLVDERAEVLREEHLCRSDDEHVIALAQVSKARLLFSNDRDLQQDFGDPDLISKPRGKVYSTLKGKAFTKSHEWLLSRNLCAGGC